MDHEIVAVNASVQKKQRQRTVSTPKAKTRSSVCDDSVKNLISTILGSLNPRNRVQAAISAHEQGLLSIGTVTFESP